jgi:hypothetical protein
MLTLKTAAMHSLFSWTATKFSDRSLQLAKNKKKSRMLSICILTQQRFNQYCYQIHWMTLWSYLFIVHLLYCTVHLLYCATRLLDGCIFERRWRDTVSWLARCIRRGNSWVDTRGRHLKHYSVISITLRYVFALLLNALPLWRVIASIIYRSRHIGAVITSYSYCSKLICRSALMLLFVITFLLFFICFSTSPNP